MSTDSLVRPTDAELPTGWLPHPLPQEPCDFVGAGFVLPVHQTRLLQRLYAHARDSRIRFDEGPHVYYVDGSPTSWSVTGLVHKFCGEFDPAEAISMMRRGRNWPRAEYTSSDAAAWRGGAGDVFAAAVGASNTSQAVPDWAAHVDALTGDALESLDLVVLTGAIRALVRDRGVPSSVASEARALGAAVADSDETIRLKWDLNRDEAANRGTWMHLKCELWANRDECDTRGDEMTMFLRYVRENLESTGVRAYRTEWEVYGEPEDLAGSIDFIGRIDRPGDPDHGKIVIVDWKRSRRLRFQDAHALGRSMNSPLDRLPDSAKWHYALQLNCYAYLLETYYGLEVAWMEVACFHPDNEGQPYSYRVPRLTAVTSFLMAWQRAQVTDTVLGRAAGNLGRDFDGLKLVL